MMPETVGQQRADDEADELDAAHVVAGKPRHFRIAADGIDLPPERPVTHHVGEGGEQDDRDHCRIRDDAEQAAVRQAMKLSSTGSSGIARWPV